MLVITFRAVKNKSCMHLHYFGVCVLCLYWPFVTGPDHGLDFVTETCGVHLALV